MSVRWRKVVGDARQNGVQIGLIALALTLGTASVVAALDARAILEREIAASYAAAKAPDVALWFDDVTPRALAFVAAQEGVAAVEARRVAYLRVAAPDGSWLPMRVTVVRTSIRSGWRRSIAMANLRADVRKRNLDRAIGPHAGRRGRRRCVACSHGDGRSRHGAAGRLRARHAVAPSTQERVIYAFATPAAAALVGLGPGFDQLLVRMQRRGDAGDAAMMAERVARASCGKRPAAAACRRPAKRPSARGADERDGARAGRALGDRRHLRRRARRLSHVGVDAARGPASRHHEGHRRALAPDRGPVPAARCPVAAGGRTPRLAGGRRAGPCAGRPLCERAQHRHRGLGCRRGAQVPRSRLHARHRARRHGVADRPRKPHAGARGAARSRHRVAADRGIAPREGGHASGRHARHLWHSGTRCGGPFASR